MLHPTNRNLHLPDLTIRGFRGISDLSISRLGRVTLVAGKNGSGKTTLLEAVQVYAARGRYAILNSQLRRREELLEEVDEDGAVNLAADWAALFHGRSIPYDVGITIGPYDYLQQVRIRVVIPKSGRFSYFINGRYFEEALWIRTEFRGEGIEFPALQSNLQQLVRTRRESSFPPVIDCTLLGPGLPENSEVSRFWDSIALTDDEDLAVETLGQITNERVERVAVIGQGSSGPKSNHGRRVMAKVAGENAPIPLKSLGDGATRFFALALALANSRDGFLVIDEAENGIHHSMQRALWKMVLQTAFNYNVQVFAATHSWDCVRGFAQAAMELEDIDGALLRLERHGDKTRAIEYSEEELQVVAEQGIEVR